MLYVFIVRLRMGTHKAAANRDLQMDEGGIARRQVAHHYRRSACGRSIAIYRRRRIRAATGRCIF